MSDHDGTRESPEAIRSGDQSDSDTLSTVRDDLIGQIESSIGKLEFVYTDDSIREHLDLMRTTLRAQVRAYFDHVGTRRSILASHTSTMYAESVSVSGVITTTFRGLVDSGTLSSAYAARLMQFVSDRRTVLVFGKRHSGKSTVLNALFGLLSVDERVVAIENGPDLPALKDRSFCVHFNIDARTDASGAFAKARRMNASRLAIGELHAAETKEFITFLAAAQTSGLGTLRASTVEEALEALAQGFDGEDHLAHDAIAKMRPVLAHVQPGVNDMPRVSALWSVDGMTGDKLDIQEIAELNSSTRELVAEA
ncbi:MAG: ATPase, T2SS/T4P/T4SS family [Thermoleophilia bacterium]